MVKKIIIFIFLFLLISEEIFSFETNTNDLKVNYPDNSSKIFKLITLNLKDYITLDDLAQIVFQDKAFEISDDKIYGINSSIKTAIGSLFVVIEFNQELRIIQLNLPVIQYDKQTLVPYRSFFLSSNEIGIIKSKQSQNLVELLDSKISKLKTKNEIEKPKLIEKTEQMIKIIEIDKKLVPPTQVKPLIQKNGHTKNNNVPQNIILPKKNVEQKIKKEEIPEIKKLNEDIILKFDSTKSIHKPNTYEIPQNLIRKEIRR